MKNTQQKKTAAAETSDSKADVYARQKRYAEKKGKRTFGVVVIRDTEPEVYAKLESVDNISRYVKDLILADITREKGEE